MTRPDDIPSAPIKDGTSVPGEVRELVYRPNEFDDWGMIRTTDGEPFATVTRPLSRDEANEHRRQGTDPFEALARTLMQARATRTTQETRDEAVRQRAVEDERIREDERDRLLMEVDGVRPPPYRIACRQFLLQQGALYPTDRAVLRFNRAAIRKPANEEGGGEDGYLVRIGFREDGGLRVSSPDVPGLVLSHRNVDGVLQDMITVLRDHRAVSPPPSDQSGGTGK